MKPSFKTKKKKKRKRKTKKRQLKESRSIDNNKISFGQKISKKDKTTLTAILSLHEYRIHSVFTGQFS